MKKNIKNIKSTDSDNCHFKRLLYAAFCGTGKSYLCNNFAKYIEFECWKYREGDFPTNYIIEINGALGKYPYIFISTDPIVLKRLAKNGIAIKLIFPRNELKAEYLERFKQRDNHIDFINTLDKYWDVWLDELKKQNYCEQIILNSGEYLQDIF